MAVNLGISCEDLSHSQSRDRCSDRNLRHFHFYFSTEYDLKISMQHRNDYIFPGLQSHHSPWFIALPMLPSAHLLYSDWSHHCSNLEEPRSRKNEDHSCVEESDRLSLNYAFEMRHGPLE